MAVRCHGCPILHRQHLQAFGFLLAASVVVKLTMLHHAAHLSAALSRDGRLSRDKQLSGGSFPAGSETRTAPDDAELREMWKAVAGVNAAVRGVEEERAMPSHSSSQHGETGSNIQVEEEKRVANAQATRDAVQAPLSAIEPQQPISSDGHDAPQVAMAGEAEYVWVFHNSDGGYKYNHMATSEVLSDGRLVVAWQRAHISEGLNDQELVWSMSADGGRNWTEAEVVPGRVAGIMWTPSLFRPPGGALRLFYTESHGCWWCESTACFKAHCRSGAANCNVTVPFGSTKINLAKLAKESRRRLHSAANKEARVAAKPGGGIASISWRAGGDLKVVTADVTAEGLQWGEPQVILSEEEQGPVPKVIANPPIVDPRSGRWILPYWRETPRGEVVCPTRVTGGDFASVLISEDEGRSWRSGPDIKMPDPWTNLTKPDWLIEGSVAPSKDGSMLLQAFRTAREKAYMARSLDGGESWLPAEATPLPNPNAKMNILRLSNGALAAAYNAHGSEQYKRRSLMTVSVSGDDGRSWSKLATLESRLVQELRFHYPMLRQMGCKLLLTYSVMTPLKSQERGGIRLVELPICFGPAHAECACE